MLTVSEPEFIRRWRRSLTNYADQQAVETLLTMAEQYAGHTKSVSKQGGSSARDVLKTDNVQAVQYNLRTLIERFANYTSLDSFFESLNTVYRDAEKDPELRNWFTNVDNLIRYVNWNPSPEIKTNPI